MEGLSPWRRGVTEDARTSGPEGTNTARHLLDWGPPPGPKGGLADRKEVVVSEVRESWTRFDKKDRPAIMAIPLMRVAEKHRPSDKPPSFILKALEDARLNVDMRDAFALAHRLLVAQIDTLPAEATEWHDPIPGFIVQGAGLPTKRKAGNQPEPEKRAFLAIQIAQASWLTGLPPTSDFPRTLDEVVPTNDLPSAADLVARGTSLTFGYVAKTWSKPIDGRHPSYLLERWERESNEFG